MYRFKAIKFVLIAHLNYLEIYFKIDQNKNWNVTNNSRSEGHKTLNHALHINDNNLPRMLSFHRKISLFRGFCCLSFFFSILFRSVPQLKRKYLNDILLIFFHKHFVLNFSLCLRFLFKLKFIQKRAKQRYNEICWTLTWFLLIFITKFLIIYTTTWRLPRFFLSHQLMWHMLSSIPYIFIVFSRNR